MTIERDLVAEKPKPAANFQFQVNPERVPWIHASLMNQQEVMLYNGEFPEPFYHLSYQVSVRQNELIMLAVLGAGDDFNEQVGEGLGTEKNLSALTKRYDEHQFSPDNKALVLIKNGEIKGAVSRHPNGSIIIQRGGQAGKAEISDQTPVSDLANNLNQFNTLIQRYVNAIWNSASETNRKQFQLALVLPQIPDGAPRTYFSVYENLSPDFIYFPRPVAFNEIGGHQKLKDVLKGLYVDMTDPDTSRKFGTQPFSNKFILVSGEEGTGKSLFARAIDSLMREKFSDNFEHLRLSIEDLITKYGRYAPQVVETVLAHVRENEKAGVKTLLNIDSVHALIPPTQRQFATNGKVEWIAPVSQGEFSFYLETANPIISSLRSLGREIGADSRNIIVFGESRAPSQALPEGIRKSFRRAFHLDPTPDDTREIIMAQINVTRQYAGKTNFDPIDDSIDEQIEDIASEAIGLTGRDIQQAFLAITSSNKANFDGEHYPKITPDQLKQSLRERRMEKGITMTQPRELGFHRPKR